MDVIDPHPGRKKKPCPVHPETPCQGLGLREQAPLRVLEAVRVMENLAENPQKGRSGFPTDDWGTFKWA